MKSKPGPNRSENSLKHRGLRKAFYVEPHLWEQVNYYSKEQKKEKSKVLNEAIELYLGQNLQKSSGDRKHFNVISLFSGCGGMDLGFRGDFKYLGKEYPSHALKTGKSFNITFANDIMESACAEYMRNFNIDPLAGHIHCGDVKDFLDELAKMPSGERVQLFPMTADVVVGGFPCQDFSVAGRRKGFESERGKLYRQMLRVVDMTNPKIFVAENVKGLTNLGTALEKIKKDFAKAGRSGYRITSKLHHAADFGVPQTRERVFIVGVRSDLDQSAFEFPLETHSDTPEETGLTPWVSAKAALDDLLGDKSAPNQNQYSRAKNYGSHCQGNRKIRADRPGPTIRAEHHGNIEFHYSEARRLTVRECARIQSFPDDFVFESSPSAAYKLIGNAVPPVLAWHIADSVAKALKKWGNKLAVAA